MNPHPCPFCAPDPARVFFEGNRVFGLWDGFPVTDYHALIIPYRHVASWVDATEEEKTELFQAISLVMKSIEGASSSPGGYNIGLNLGFAAGQTIDHLHLHVIPRYEGDVPDPRGGIRWVIPERARYWEDD